MKYNLGYRKLTVDLAPGADPSPMTVEGTKAITERYYALKRANQPKSIVNGFSDDNDYHAIRENFSILDPHEQR